MNNPKQIIASRFELGELIGMGGMGEVYKGYDRQTTTTVAIKRLKSDIVRNDPELVKRFEREADMLRRLNHPNIVSVIASITEADNHYLVMEYVSGGSLQDILQQSEPLPIKRILEIALDLADALTRAHRLNIIHRDIKPANVLIAEDGTPRLTDFGIAHMGDNSKLTATGSIIGTYAYLSPEACNGEELDERADIWAFGVMLYEFIAGCRPFEGQQAGTVIAKILTENPPDILDLRPDVAPALATLVMNMLEKDREARIPTVRRVGTELESLLKGIDTTAPHLHTPLTPAPSRFATPTPSNRDDKTYIAKDTSVASPSALSPTRKRLLQGLGVVGIIILLLLGLNMVVKFETKSKDENKDEVPSSQVVAYEGTPVDPSEYLVLVAKLEPLDPEARDTTRFIVDSLTQELEIGIPQSHIFVRYYPQIVSSYDQARAIAETHQADIIIWGSYTDTFSQLEIQAGAFDTTMPFSRSTVEQVTNHRVRITDPFNETLSINVASSLNIIEAAYGDAFNSLLLGSATQQLPPTAAPVIGDTVAARFFRAGVALSQGDSDGFLSGIDSALELAQNPLVYIQRSTWYLSQGLYDNSTQDSITAERIAPANWVLPRYIRSIDDSNMPTSTAIKTFTDIIALTPDDWYPYYNRGSLYYFIGEWDKAQVDLEYAIGLNPRASFPYAIAALLALREGRMGDMVSYMQTVVREFPDPNFGQRLLQATFGENAIDITSILLSAFTNLSIAQYSEVIAQTEDGLQIAPLYDFFVMRGLAQCNLNDLEGSLETYTTALTFYPNDTILIWLQSGAYHDLGDAQAEESNIRITNNDLDPQFTEALAASYAGKLTCQNFFTYHQGD
ncbi:MAG: protein kinase [Anaerolineales bacterium]|nr:protein kinase [Anaerolineales bacterium]